MNELMQTLYTYTLANLLEGNYKLTGYYEWREKRDAAGRQLWEQLPPDQRLLLEEVQRSYDRTESCELEAMFLSAFDLWSSLSRHHGG